MSDEPRVEPDDVELDAAQRRALEALRDGPRAPVELEGRVVSALRARGLLDGAKPARGGSTAASSWRRWSIAAGLAASVLAFAGGWWARGAVPVAGAGAVVGGGTERATADRYVLLLHDTGRALPASEEARLVAEYTEWARELRSRGMAIDGEKLEDARWLLGPGGRREEPGLARGALAGYFLLATADPAAALAVAESCPHLRHGGSVELRRIAVLRRG